MPGSTHKPVLPSNDQVRKALDRLLAIDPYLKAYKKIIHRRLSKIIEAEIHLADGKMTLADFASGHEYFGLHFQNNQWVFREWAPNADKIFLIGDMTGWLEEEAFSLKRLDNDTWEIRLPSDTFKHKNLYRLRIHWPGGVGDRIPVYARRVVQDSKTLIFNAQVWLPAASYQWQCRDIRRADEAGH